MKHKEESREECSRTHFKKQLKRVYKKNNVLKLYK